METNKRRTTLPEQAADDRRLYSVLRDWGYTETEIQRFLADTKARTDRALPERRNVTDQSTSLPHAWS